MNKIIIGIDPGLHKSGYAEIIGICQKVVEAINKLNK